MSQVTLDDLKAEHARLAELIASFERQSKTLLLLPEAEIPLGAGERYAGAILSDDGKISLTEGAVLRQFQRIVAGDADYATTEKKTTINPKTNKKTTTETPIPLVVTSLGVSWLSAYNAPHWLDLSVGAGTKLSGWFDKTSAADYGTSWVRDLMLASQNALSASRYRCAHSDGGVSSNRSRRCARM